MLEELRKRRIKRRLAKQTRKGLPVAEVSGNDGMVTPVEERQKKHMSALTFTRYANRFSVVTALAFLKCLLLSLSI